MQHHSEPGARSFSNGGKGGDANADATSSDAINHATANGGAGGSGGGGHPGGGNGGNASAHAANTTVTTDSVASVATANGGTGGAPEFNNGTPGNGGSATASASGMGMGNANSVSVQAFATGGNSGNSDVGANGGVATLGSVTGSSDIGNVGVGGQVTGGNGNNQPGGHGADASVTNAVSGNTAGILTLNQTAIGGVGRVPGNASSSLTFSTTTSSELYLTTRANGGDAGLDNQGGSANSFINASNSVGLCDATLYGRGGGGGNTEGGTGGDVTASATAHTDGDGHIVKIVSRTQGGGGDPTVFGGVGGQSQTGNGGKGGVPTGSASGTASGNSDVIANIAVVGGGGGAGVNGGDGGSAVLTSVTGSSNGGSVDVRGQAIGGEGAQTNGSGNGGNGGSVILTNAASGNSTGPVTLVQTATGGNGGPGDATTGTGGAGGNASSSFDAGTSSSNNLIVQGFATGGTGGSGAAPGNGGNASATVAASSSATANISAGATSGRGGGNVSTGTAVAHASGTAVGGGLFTSAVSQDGVVTNLITRTNDANLGSAHAAESRSGVATPVPDFSQTSGLQSVAFATGRPSNADAFQAVMGNPNVAAAFDIGGSSIMLGLVTLGGSGPAALFSGEPTSQAYFNFSVSSFAGQAIKMGLINPHSTGNGFSQLTFEVYRGGFNLVSRTFTSLAAALDYFDDHVLTLGSASSFNGSPLILKFFLERNPGDSFHASMLIGTANIAPLSLNTAASRKTHNTAGTFDINMPLSGPSGVECRTGGANGDHMLVFTFNNDVMSGSASVTSGTGSVAGNPSFSGNTMTVNLTGVTNAQRSTVTLSNVTDVFSQVISSANVTAGFLLGDSNGNGNVNASDTAQSKARIGQSINQNNFRSDPNINGAINASDVGLIKARSGTALP